jgi:hypothetical protein
MYLPPYWTLSTTLRRHNKLPLSERYFDKRSTDRFLNDTMRS